MTTSLRRALQAGRFLPALFGVVVAIAQTPPTQAPLYYFTTLAGTASAGADDGNAATARFYGPSGVTLDRNGNLFVADLRNSTIRRITPAGAITTLAGKAGSRGSADGTGSAARFDFFGLGTPGAGRLVADSAGNLFAVDTGNCTIRKITPDGVVTTLAGTAGSRGVADGTGAAAQFYSPYCIAIDAADNLYVIDAASLRKITPAGVVTSLFPVGNASDLVLDGAGNFYVSYAASIGKISPGGTISVLAGPADLVTTGSADGVGSAARFSYPGGLAFDRSGNLFVADSRNHTLRRITADGTVSTFAGAAGAPGSTDGTSTARFSNPGGLAFDGAGNLYVGDEGNNSIRRVTPAGVVTTVAGVAPDKTRGSTDGAGTAARFNLDYRSRIAVTLDGTAYVSDSGNYLIRRISREGVVSMLAGKAGESGRADGTGAEARFTSPGALALDAAGNLLVADGGVLRKITTAGVVTTLAGNPELSDNPVDGSGTGAGFSSIASLAVAPDGNIWVGEGAGASKATSHRWWARLRKVTPSGLVTGLGTTDSPIETTIGSHSSLHSLVTDGTGRLYSCDTMYYTFYAATATDLQSYRFDTVTPAFTPGQAAVRSPDQVFLVDGSFQGPNRIGWLNSAGQFEIIAGAPGGSTHKDALGTEARFTSITGIAVDGAGSFYLTDQDQTIRKGVLATAPTIVAQPQSQSVVAGNNVQFSVSAAGAPEPNYQWSFNGSTITGATAASYGITGTQVANQGDYTVTITNALGNVTSSKATLTVAAASAPPPSSGGGSAGGAGGGGGAPSTWFLLALGTLGAVRAWRRRLAAAICG